MTRVSLTVNDEPVSAEVEPRMHLADFLRETQLLTGTHIGCEHGVCGACTIQIDGAPDAVPVNGGNDGLPAEGDRERCSLHAEDDIEQSPPGPC